MIFFLIWSYDWFLINFLSLLNHTYYAMDFGMASEMAQMLKIYSVALSFGV